MKIFGVATNCNDARQPVFFTKADSTLLKNHKPFFRPDWCRRVDYEAQLVVRICRLGKGIPLRYAHRYYDALTVGVDFTARDVLEQARREGLPWTAAKDFDGSTVIGDWLAIGDDEKPSGHAFRLDVNGHTVQQATTAQLSFGIDELIAHISVRHTLKTGDLLFTGTPPGWGPVNVGDHLQGRLDGHTVLDFFCR